MTPGFHVEWPPAWRWLGAGTYRVDAVTTLRVGQPIASPPDLDARLAGFFDYELPAGGVVRRTQDVSAQASSGARVRSVHVAIDVAGQPRLARLGIFLFFEDVMVASVAESERPIDPDALLVVLGRGQLAPIVPPLCELLAGTRPEKEVLRMTALAHFSR